MKAKFHFTYNPYRPETLAARCAMHTYTCRKWTLHEEIWASEVLYLKRGLWKSEKGIESQRFAHLMTNQHQVKYLGVPYLFLSIIGKKTKREKGRNCVHTNSLLCGDEAGVNSSAILWCQGQLLTCFKESGLPLCPPRRHGIRSKIEKDVFPTWAGTHKTPSVFLYLRPGFWPAF